MLCVQIPSECNSEKTVSGFVLRCVTLTFCHFEWHYLGIHVHVHVCTCTCICALVKTYVNICASVVPTSTACVHCLCPSLHCLCPSLYCLCPSLHCLCPYLHCLCPSLHCLCPSLHCLCPSLHCPLHCLCPSLHCLCPSPSTACVPIYLHCLCPYLYCPSPIQAKPYKNNPEILAMTNLVQSYQNDDIAEFEKILRTNRWW